MFIHSDRGSSLMSHELKEFCMSKGISTSRTTPYNPQGNGQVEKSNGTIWRAVTMDLKTRGWPQSLWQEVLPNVMHSIRTLLCTATNVTPHERLLGFPRRSGTGTSIPTWLTAPGPVLLRRYVRRSKQDPLVDEVDLIEANTQYAHVRHANGREDTVSIRDLAPVGDVSMRELVSDNREVPEWQSAESVGEVPVPIVADQSSEIVEGPSNGSERPPAVTDETSMATPKPLMDGSNMLKSNPALLERATKQVFPEQMLRRSGRETKPPAYLNTYILK